MDEMLAQAAAELPHECCGLLAGNPPPSPLTTTASSPPVARVLRCYPLINAAASPVEYFSDPKSMFAAVRDMRESGLDILAVYHSHPTSAPVPSRIDLQRNYSPDVVNMIISLKNAKPQIRAWWLTGENFRQADWECVE